MKHPRPRPSFPRASSDSARRRPRASFPSKHPESWEIQNMATIGNVGGLNKMSLPLIDMEAELKKFEEEERKRLGLDTKTEHWIEDMPALHFHQDSRAHVP